MRYNIKNRSCARFVWSFVVTFVVVMIVFSFSVEKENTIHTLCEEFPSAIVIVVLLETFLQMAVNRQEIRGRRESWQNIVIYLLISTVVIGGLFSFMPIGISYLLVPDFEMGHITYLILKSIVVALAGASAGSYTAYYYTTPLS